MRVLLATDGSKHSHAAIDLLARLPLLSKRTVLLTVVESAHPLFAAEHPVIARQVEESFAQFRAKLRQGAARMLQREEKHLRAKGFLAKTMIREGHIADEIVRTCKELGTDLLIAGSRGLGGFRRLLLGSVSQQVLKHAPCSVLVARSKDDRGGKSRKPRSVAAGRASRLKILLAFDGSPDARAAVKVARSLPLGNRAAVTLLTVVPELSRYGLDSASVRLLTEVWEGEKQAARAALERAARQVAAVATHVSSRLREGDPAEQIVKAARQVDADIIMLGAKGRSAIEKFFLGGVASHVAAHASGCSVWVVRS